MFEPRRLLLIFRSDPKVTGHDGAIRADDKFSELDLPLIRFHHAGVDQTQVGFAPEFFIVIIHRLLYLHT